MSDEPQVNGRQPGLHFDVPEADYHADKLCDVPTLSRSEAQMLLEDSPLHLWCAHPRLGNKTFVAPTPGMDMGSAAHALVLGTGSPISVVEADNWQTKAARETRDSIREEGKLPLLKKEYERALQLTSAFHLRLNEYGFKEEFEAGQSEVTALCHDGGGVFLRARFDRLVLSGDKATIFDLKFCESANPSSLPRQILNMGYALQDQFYTHTLQMVDPRLGGRIRFVFLFLETTYPYAMTPVELNGEFKMLGISKLTRAVDAWKKCRAEGRWPSYVREVLRVEPPAWGLAQEMGAKPIL